MKKTSGSPSLVARALAFLRRGQWQVRAEELPWLQGVALKSLRIGSLVVAGFKRNRCPLHAGALTFHSLMALVPILVLALALARTFGLDSRAREQIDSHVNEWLAQFGEVAEADGEGWSEWEWDDDYGWYEPDAPLQSFTAQVKEVVDKLYTQVERINFGTLGGIGLVMLLWAAISVLGKVEQSFNAVWGVEKSRPWVRKFFDYLGVILILPFLIMAVSSVPVASKVMDIMNKAMGVTSAQSILSSAFFRTGTTLVFGTLLFAFLLGFMPNERVKTRPALIGGFVTIILISLWLKVCAMLQVGIGKYSALYGGFAVLPILLMWVNISWQIVLLGAEIAFAAQNRDTYTLEQYATDASLRARLMLALALCAEAARQAKVRGGGPFAAEAFARAKGIPHRFAREVLEHLTRNHIFAQVAGEPGQYLLYRCGDIMTVAEITAMFLNTGENPSTLGLDSLGPEAQGLDKAITDVIGQHLAIPVISGG